MSCFWRNKRNCREDCGGTAPFMGMFKNGAGAGNPTDVVDPLTDSLNMYCLDGDVSTINGITSGHVYLVSDFNGCSMLASPINDAGVDPSTCAYDDLVAFLSGLTTPFDGDVPPLIGDSWTNEDLGLTASGYGIYTVDTDVGERTMIVIAHICY